MFLRADERASACARSTRFWRRARLRPQRMPAGGPPGQVPIRALTCVDRDWLPGRGVHRRIISNGLGERGLASDQDALGAAVRTVPPCVQGECYPRISPYPLELLPDVYRAVHHGERAPRAVADAEVHHRGEQDASRRRHVGEQDDTVTLEDFVCCAWLPFAYSRRPVTCLARKSRAWLATGRVPTPRGPHAPPDRRRSPIAAVAYHSHPRGAWKSSCSTA